MDEPWEVPDGLWERIEPLLPKRERRFRHPGRKPLDDRLVLQGILFVLHTGIGERNGGRVTPQWELRHWGVVSQAWFLEAGSDRAFQYRVTR